jgi:hypothetical protein
MTENVWSRFNRFFVSIASIAVYIVFLWKSGAIAELRASVLTPIALFRERNQAKFPSSSP